jgi:hypothetical protein
MAEQQEQVGPYTVVSKRVGTQGEYWGVVGNSVGLAVYRTPRFSDPGAKERAFQHAKSYVATLLSAMPVQHPTDHLDGDPDEVGRLRGND